MTYKIGAFQTQDIQGDMSASLRVIAGAMAQADTEGIDILCFPECFLQGYTLDDKETEQRAINLASSEFNAVLHTLANHKVTIILGLIEEDAGNFYNAAAVIREGKLLGAYRKVHLFEHNFQPGEAQSVFSVNGLRFGINICYDARFPEGAAELAAQSAKVIFYPLNNRLLHEKAASYRDKHIPNLVTRAQESSCWVISSDVIAQDETHTAYGCTAIVDPSGHVVTKVTELSSGFITAEIKC